ncbi:MAG: hypothetical protein LUH50_08810 [Bacteroides intestinalis]|nr:hypothetical protein [Bacteroides intestinalis]
MYDKVKLILYVLPTRYDWQSVLKRIVAQPYFADGTGGSGLWLGRKVIATETYVSFEGSLPKCLCGHNLKTLSLREVKWLIMKLSKDLGVPMYEAVVESAEFAHNFSMKEPPIMYMQKLDAMKTFKPNGWSGTKYMDNKEVRCKFYDKMKEAKKKRELPKYGKENLPKNLLRYEVTFYKKGLDKLFGRDIVAEELWSKQVFWTLVAEWFGYYEDMVKLPNDCWDVDYHIFESAKDFAKWCICIANADQNLSYYVKSVLFKLRANPQPADRVLHG